MEKIELGKGRHIEVVLQLDVLKLLAERANQHSGAAHIQSAGTYTCIYDSVHANKVMAIVCFPLINHDYNHLVTL